MWKRFASSHMQLNLDDSFVNEQVIANSGSGAGVSIVVSCGEKTGEGAFRWEKNWKMNSQRKRLFWMLCMHWYHSSWTMRMAYTFLWNARILTSVRSNYTLFWNSVVLEYKYEYSTIFGNEDISNIPQIEQLCTGKSKSYHGVKLLAF